MKYGESEKYSDDESLETSHESTHTDEVCSVSDRIDRIGIGVGTILIAIFSGSFFCLESCELTLLAFLIPELRKEWGLSGFQSSLIGTVVYIGIFLGSIFWGFVSDRIGRKDTTVLCAVGTAFFGCLAAISFNLYFLLFCELIVGFCIGGSIVSFSFYTEFLPRKYRGITMNGVEIFWSVGVICETALCWIILTSFERYAWNFLVLATVAPCLVCIFLAPFIPRSPRYLFIKQNVDDLEKSLRWLDRMNCKLCPCPPKDQDKSEDSEDGKIDNETYERVVNGDYELLKNTNNNHKISFDDEENEDEEFNGGCCKSQKRKVKYLLCSKKCRKDVKKCVTFESSFLYFCLIVFYTASSFGYNGVALACPNFFSAENRFLGSFIISFSELPGLFLSAVGMATIGRIWTQSLTFLICGLSLGLLLFPRENLVEHLIFGIFARGSALATGCVTWVISQESLSTEFRSFGSGIAAGIGKVSTCFSPILVELFPQNNSFVPKAVFALSTIFAGVLCFFYPYESKGKELQDFVDSEKNKKVEYEKEEFDRMF